MAAPSPPGLARCGERPWDSWLRELGRVSPLADGTRDAKEDRRGVARLARDGMRLFGEFPGADPLLAAVCCLCGLTVKCCSLRDHLVEEHRDGERESPAPGPTLAPPPPAKPKSRSRTGHRSRDAPASARSAPRPPAAPSEPPPSPPTAPIVVDRVGDPEPAKAEVEVSVEEDEPPVVSIRDPTEGTEAASAEANADDIIEIMNSEGIRSVEDAVERRPPEPKRIAPPVRGRAPPRTVPIVAEPPPVVVVATPVSRIRPPPPPRRAPTRPSKAKCPTREYDPDRHCGVPSGECPKPCTRSLTCKSHALSLRRAVEGRSKTFDALLAEHRAARQAAAPAAASVSPLPPRKVSPDGFAAAPIARTIVVVPSETDREAFAPRPIERVRPPEPTEAPKIEMEECMPPDDRLAVPDPDDLYVYPREPRPLAPCPFAVRRMGDSFFLNRKLASIRADFRSLSRSRTSGMADDPRRSLASLSKPSPSGGARAGVPEVRRLVRSHPFVNGADENGDLAFSDGVRGPNGHPSGGGKRVSGDFDGLKCGDPPRGKMSKRTDPLELNFLLDPMMNDEKC